VRTWSSIVWATTVSVFIGVVESDAQAAPVCFVVEIPTDPSDRLPDNTSSQLGRLYAKADPAPSSIIAPALPIGRTGAAKGTRTQDEIAVTLSVREKAFLAGQPWTTYCAAKVVSQAPPEIVAPPIASTRAAFAGHYARINATRRHEWRVRWREHSHLQARVRSISRHSRATTLLRRS
jgi:hypothetical protein